jgi:gluconolactonase
MNASARHSVGLALILLFTGAAAGESPSKANSKTQKESRAYDTFGSIERKDARLDALIPPEAKLEKLAEGFDWSEGPVWFAGGVVFSDVPQNVVYRWKEKEGITVFLRPSGYTGSVRRGGEPGSNGLTVDSRGRLVLCEHGDRRVGRIERDGSHSTLARYYQWRRFNSPNDLTYKSNGDLYFTDPPYGLEKNNADPAKEIPYNGVYRLDKRGRVTLLTTELSFPNGIAFSPDETKLYVANSDPKAAYWKVFDVRRDGTIENGRVFFDSTADVSKKKGLPDGLKLDRSGNLFATGPGGVLILSPDGEHLGTIETGEATGNCCWGNDGSVLYICADMYLGRVKTSTRGKVPGRSRLGL